MNWFLFVSIGFLSLKLSICDINGQPSAITAFDTTDDTLIFAHVIFRHGARNIASSYPTDPHKDERNWPGGFGQLTNEGKTQLFELGQYFRRRYAKLLGDKYSPNKVYVQSTDVDRAIMSAQANLAGLFIPTEDEEWNKNILWQPIPVHTVPSKLDQVLAAGRNCPKYTALYKKYMDESPEVQRIYREYGALFTYLTQMSGKNISTITDCYWLYNTLEIEKEQNKTLPEWAEKVMEPNGPMEYIAKFDYKTYADTPQLARLKSGFLFKEIMEHFLQKANSTLTPNRSLWLYSGHDITILNLLNGLGMFKLHFSPYASSLHLELFKSRANEYYVQIFYRKAEGEYPAPMTIPNCGEKCPLNRFLELNKEIIPGDFEVECHITNHSNGATRSKL